MRRSPLVVLVLLLGLGRPLWAASYYVNSAGSDLNPGTLALPWKTVIPVNAATFAPGDQVLFAAGQTFAGGITLTAADSGAAGNPVILGSYGVGRATLAPPVTVTALSILDGQWIEAQDLILSGLAGATPTNGVLLTDSAAAARQHFWMRNCDISNFGGSGFYVVAGSSAGGYHDVSVTATDFHDNQDAGVDFDATFWDQSPRQHGNFYFGGCRFYNNITSGIILVEVSGALVEHCEARNNGPSSGCIGFWCWDSDHVVFQYCESHHNTRTVGGSDGGGFDLDGATQDSILQYNYSHDNDGGGFALYQFGWAEQSGPMINNIIRYNVSENDGRKGGYGGISMYGDGFYTGQPPPGDWVDYTEIYNNTVFTSSPASAAVEFISTFNKNIHFYNNIFYNTNVANFIHRPAGVDDGSVTFRGNEYWRTTGSFRVDFDGTIYSSMAAWRGSGVAKQEMEGATVRGYNVDPLLTAAGTGGTIYPAALSSLLAYQLQVASPMRDAGLDMTTRLVLPPVPGSQDFWGGAIPQGTVYDMGAHELPYLSPTITPTSTQSPTFSPSPTVSPTGTISPTLTVSPTLSASPSTSPTPTITPTGSVTPVRSDTFTSTVSPTLSATLTASPTATVSPVLSATSTGAATRTPVPFAIADRLVILQHRAVPDPQSGPRFGFAALLSRPISRARISLYTVGMVKLREAEALPGNWAGWQKLDFEMPGLPNGLLYYVLEVEDPLGQKARSDPGKLFVAR